MKLADTHHRHLDYADKLLPIVAVLPLVLSVIIMGLKLPWFRRQMRLGSMSQMTANSSKQRQLTAQATSVPSQGVFRRLSFRDDTPPTPPPRREVVRPKSTPNVPTPTPPAVKTRATTSAAPAAKQKQPAVVVAPPPPKSKTKVAPPTRRNPNAPAFSVVSAAAQAKPAAASSPPLLLEASNPLMMRDDDLPNGHIGITTNRSPKPTGKKKDPKARHSKVKSRDKKNSVFAKMTPRAVSLDSSSSPDLQSAINLVPDSKQLVTPERPAVLSLDYGSGEDEDGDDDGAITFRRGSFNETRRVSLDDEGTLTLRTVQSPQPLTTQPNFLYDGVGDSDECDA